MELDNTESNGFVHAKDETIVKNSQLFPMGFFYLCFIFCVVAFWAKETEHEYIRLASSIIGIIFTIRLFKIMKEFNGSMD